MPIIKFVHVSRETHALLKRFCKYKKITLTALEEDALNYFLSFVLKDNAIRKEYSSIPISSDRVAIRIDEELHARVVDFCKNTGVSINRLAEISSISYVSNAMIAEAIEKKQNEPLGI